MMRGLTLIGLFFWATNILAQPLDLPRHSPVPGGIAVITLAHTERPTAFYNDKRVLVTGSSGQWAAVIGIPLDAAPGAHVLRVVGQSGEQTVPFTVTAKEYEEQRLTIKNKRMVEPTAEDLKRIQKEGAIVAAALARFSEGLEATFRFIPPAQGVLSSPFGLRRYFNEQPRKPHTGLDIAAPVGTAIVAPAAARVVAVGNYFFNGHNVVLDHGQGLVTMYSHLNRVLVREGQQVAQGARIGTVGMTGRVTGPHLHWTVSLNDTRVDPTLLFDPETLATLSSQTAKVIPESEQAPGAE